MDYWDLKIRYEEMIEQMQYDIDRGVLKESTILPTLEEFISAYWSDCEDD